LDRAANPTVLLARLEVRLFGLEALLCKILDQQRMGGDVKLEASVLHSHGCRHSLHPDVIGGRLFVERR
jgi:hypothetical protein